MAIAQPCCYGLKLKNLVDYPAVHQLTEYSPTSGPRAEELGPVDGTISAGQRGVL